MEEKIRAVIVDDELNCRENLNIIIQEFCPEVEVVATAESAEKAREIIAKTTPNVVFLDIAMPTEDGFSLLKSLPERNFSVVFTTAHNEYALQAFKQNAVDYLEKPINIEDLQNAIVKVKQYSKTGENNTQESIDTLLRESTSQADKITIPTKGGFIIAHNEEVINLDASDNYTIIHLTDGREYISSKNIKVFEDNLNPDVFFRVHKSHIVNVKYHLKEFSRSEGNYVKLSNGKYVPVSRRKVSAFLEHLHAF